MLSSRYSPDGLNGWPSGVFVFKEDPLAGEKEKFD